MKTKQLAKRVAADGTGYNTDWGLRLSFNGNEPGKESSTGFLTCLGGMTDMPKIRTLLVKHKQWSEVELWAEVVQLKDGKNRGKPVAYSYHWLNTWDLPGGEPSIKEWSKLARKIAKHAGKFKAKVRDNE